MSEKVVELKGEILEKLRDQCKQDLFFFAKFILGYDRMEEDIHGPICDLLMDRRKRRKKIVIPRGWYKSTICTIAYPIWRVIQDPNVRILVVQNNAVNSWKKLAEIKQRIKDNSKMRVLFPEIYPESGKWAIDRQNAFQVNRTLSNPEATFEASGPSGLVSRHYNVIIEDDTIAPDKDEFGEDVVVPSKTDVEQAIGFHQSCFPLLVDPYEDEIIIVCTRWYVKDLSSWIDESFPWDEETGTGFYSITRAAKEDEDGNPDPENGRLVWPKRFPQEALDELEKMMGPYLFKTLYFNMPVDTSDMIFKPEWIQDYLECPQGIPYYTTVDPAGDPTQSRGKVSDYSVVMTCAKDPSTGEVYVVRYTQEKMTAIQLINSIFEHVRMFNPVIVGFEDIGYQRSLKNFILERQIKEDLPFMVEGINTSQKNKIRRIESLQPYFASGLIWTQKQHVELKKELLSFPNGQHDDIIDALAMQIQFWKRDDRRRDFYKKPNMADDPWTLDGLLARARKYRQENLIDEWD